MKKWRLLDTGTLPAPLNMAIDEALLRLHVPGESQPVLRFYQWNPPAVSLGYFQKNHGIDLSACKRLGLDVVRRSTGGRAVLHQNDLTYSVVSDSRQGIPSSLESAYRLLCKGLLAGFQILGFEAELGREKLKGPNEDICFLHAGVGDIVYRGRKFVGSAQTWKGASVLQHGSIILEPQARIWAAILQTDSIDSLPYFLESRISSLSKILGRETPPDELKQAIVTGMAEALQAEFEVAELSVKEYLGASQALPRGKNRSPGAGFSGFERFHDSCSGSRSRHPGSQR